MQFSLGEGKGKGTGKVKEKEKVVLCAIGQFLSKIEVYDAFVQNKIYEPRVTHKKS